MDCYDSREFSISNYCIENEILHNLTLELNTTCNLDCIHCYIPEKTNHGLGTQTILDIVDQANDMGVLNVILTGGEIFLRSDLLAIISYIRKKYMRVFLITNGTLLNLDIIEQLQALSIAELGISLYSTNRSIHDQITTKVGSYDETVFAIKSALRKGLRVAIKTAVMTTNSRYIPELKVFCDEHGIEHELVCFITSKNNRDHSPRRFQVTDRHDMLSFLMCTLNKRSFLKELRGRDLESNPCSYCKNSLYIDSNGNVFPCNSFLVKVGNVLEDSLRAIWEGSAVLKAIQATKYSDIEGCPECSLAPYCSFCPGFSYLEYNDYLFCSDEHKSYIQCRKDYHNLILEGII